ncbi:serine/threonine protein kinase [Curtobacterium sp. PhB130]|uniref:serine/threonine-protein kinase n=1 Tax=unclassified Curtobacterium TaxID=257496 RepID=UPI000F4C90BF|nr:MULTISPECIES: serine/threonine-protein kinase [unclassified Curtobacterium]ROP63380.1 serine/threonine protein kinase [Curtobacterium sp. ZW137]ROS77644.1 serine/threonine protein kinase [Curtobacterium sp. PhB130]
MEERVFGGRYRVTGTLGHGGMASVYRAVDEQLGREVAVKVFRMGAVDHGERARAEAEIQVLAGLRSPALVTLYDAALDDADGDSYLVMELVPGSDLATRLREGPLDRSTTARVGAQVADGLAAVHAQGIVHRDVKPANVLLEADGSHVKLADFGIALLRDAARVTGTGTVMGTAAYLAPEQVTAQGISGKSDVYSLGLVLLECLTGRMPFPGSAVESATARLTRSPEIDPALPTAWRVLLHVMTATDPAERPSATEAAERLRALAYDDGAPATQLLPGGPGTLTAAAAAAGAAGATAVLGAPGSAQADEATRAMPVRGPDDDATRVMPASQASGSDDQATTILGTQRGTGEPTGGGGGPVAASPVSDAPPAKKRRRGLVITLVIVGVLVLAGIVVAVLALGNGGGTPAPTESSSTSPSAPVDEQPSDEPSQPQDEPSEPTQPSQTTAPQPSQTVEPAPSQPAEPSNGPEPSVEPTLPVQTPLDSGAADTSSSGTGAADSTSADTTSADTGPGNSENAPGHNQG